jgi:DNA end-binding protein Ku
MAIRPIASGTVSFGLVAIPVKLYSTGESASSVSFNMVHEACGTRVKYRYYCPTHDALVERDELVKGYEVSKGQYVLFSKEELAALQPEATNEIEIREFVELDQVDPIYYEKGYYLGPGRGGARPYRLLSEALRESGRAALGKYAARGKDYLVLIRPFRDGLLMQQLRYADEIRSFDEIPVDEAELKPGELQLALQLVEQTASETFDPTAYRDSQRERTWELVERKVQGEEIVSEQTAAPQAQIIDLMSALKASLSSDGEAAPTQPARKPAKRASRKKSTAKTAAGAGS